MRDPKLAHILVNLKGLVIVDMRFYAIFEEKNTTLCKMRAKSYLHQKSLAFITTTSISLPGLHISKFYPRLQT